MKKKVVVAGLVLLATSAGALQAYGPEDAATPEAAQVSMPGAPGRPDRGPDNPSNRFVQIQIRALHSLDGDNLSLSTFGLITFLEKSELFSPEFVSVAQMGLNTHGLSYPGDDAVQAEADRLKAEHDQYIQGSRGRKLF